jgi:tetratricopeptide (TPR) repeat protein
MHTKSIVLAERILGPEHPEVAESYQTLALYYNKVGYHKKAIECLQRALAIMNLSAGDMNPITT